MIWPCLQPACPEPATYIVEAWAYGPAGRIGWWIDA